MTHFPVLVFGGDVDRQLVPYHEGLEVPEYDTECWCLEHNLRVAVRAEMDRLFPGGYQALRQSFARTDRGPTAGEDARWQEHIRTYREEEDRLEHELAAAKTPSADCDECRGTGTVRSTYNPDSKWDWYVVGGRWSGEIVLKAGSGVDTALAGDVDWDRTLIPTAVVAEGHYRGLGRVGWWGYVDRTNKESWDEWFRTFRAGLPPETPVTLCDLHI
jgi:hypothetical protein